MTIDSDKIARLADGVARLSMRLDAMIAKDADYESEAFELGVKAFKAGINAPAIDQSLMSLLKKANPSGEVGGSGGSSIKLMKAWSKGWHKTNLASRNDASRKGPPLPGGKVREAHKGYLIIESPFNGMFYISKGGSDIGEAGSLAEAKKIIEQLV